MKPQKSTIVWNNSSVGYAELFPNKEPVTAARAKACFEFMKEVFRILQEQKRL